MKTCSRRNFLKTGALVSAGSAMAGGTLLSCSSKISGSSKGILRIDPVPLYSIAPTLFMQFMEPLGTTDSSVEAAWDYKRDDWREDVIQCVAGLSPGMVRWGGNFIRYYKWKEGVGPVKSRPWMYNHYWGGKETNRVGTHEFIDFCRRVGAAPLLNVNFMSDGFDYFKKTSHGENRFGTVEEAAEWVSYCNDPRHSERSKNGESDPFSVKYWQIGNETSYGGKDDFSLDEAVIHTREFAKAMKERDPSIQLIGWGDVPNPGSLNGKEEQSPQFWAGKMVEENGDLLDMIAIHLMGVYPGKTRSLIGFEYLKYPEEAWNELLELAKIAEYRLTKLKEVLKRYETKIAVTEGHLSLSPHNTNAILQTWLSAAYHARTMNTYLRHADRVSVCTGADFLGTRWTVNAVKLPVPGGSSYLLPIGTIMKLYKDFSGDKGVRVIESPEELDIAATRKDDKLFLHILNTQYSSPVKINLQIEGYTATSGIAYEIAPSDKLAYADDDHQDTFNPVKKLITDPSVLTIPSASVTVIELNLKPE
jgi:alpha-N-arabinofuranosidase